MQQEPAAGECPVDRHQLRRWVSASLASDAVITLRFVGRAESRRLNARYRGRDYPTNVLTFAYDEAVGGRGHRTVHADVLICLPVLVREAREQRKGLREHLAHLVVHGTLHAQGMNHETDDDARAMEDLEARILRRFRIDDPYRERPDR